MKKKFFLPADQNFKHWDWRIITKNIFVKTELRTFNMNLNVIIC